MQLPQILIRHGRSACKGIAKSMAGASYARARLLASFGAQSSAIRLQRAHQARPVSHQCAIGVFLAGHAERTNPMDWFPDLRTAKEHQPSAIARCCQIERAITI